MQDLRRKSEARTPIDDNGKVTVSISSSSDIGSNPHCSNKPVSNDHFKTIDTVHFKTIETVPVAPCRTTTPSESDSGKNSKSTAWSGQPAPCIHVHKSTIPVYKPGESTALRKVLTLLNGRTSVTKLSLTKQEILSHYSSCFEGIGHFPGEPYKFHLKQEHKPARHAPRKVPIHLEDAFKEMPRRGKGTY